MFSAVEDPVQRNELEDLYKKNKNLFLNIAYKYLHNKSDAEDAVQEAFGEIAGKPDNFFCAAPENRVRYMAAVVRNISAGMFNKKNKVTLEELDEDDPYDDNPLSFEDSMIGKVSRDKLKQFIESLPHILV